MIIELREVYKQSVTTTVQFEDSSDSLDADDSEKIRVRGGKGQELHTHVH